MMIKKIGLSLLSAAVLVGCVATTSDDVTQAQSNSAEAISASYNSINTAQLIEHVKVLASDKFGGRAPSSEGERLTLEYLTEQFKSDWF